MTTTDMITIGISEICNAITIADAAAKAIKNSNKFVRAINYLKPPIKIAVFGESGSGKSSFLAKVTGQHFEGETTREPNIVKSQLPNGRRIEFHDCPGQQIYRMKRKSVRNLIDRKQFHGIINVVCYGYNYSNVSTVDMFETGTSTVKKSYLEQKRKEELRQLEEWLPDLSSDTNIKWIITLINKTDIWFKDGREVLNYYNNGEYSKKFNEITRICQYHIIPYCSHIALFGGKQMEIYIDDEDKENLHNSFMSNLIECIEKNG